ncbi:MAG: hypothetical protein ISR57_02495 [Bacteroidales bacterium]|nr:hypothetical protein [Bacteroidota bacterium]MBL6949490.1 hypothetical protein [Bacteroidales bacterium]
MGRENEQMNELDRLIREALKEKPEWELSLTFTDTLLEKVEKRLWWREVIQAFAMKTAIVVGTLAILLVILILPSRDTSNPFLTLLLDNWQLVTGICLLVLFTFFSDQVLLKYFNFRVSYQNTG